MTTDLLVGTVTELLAAGKGLLAIDESTSTCDRRFGAHEIAETVEARQSHRELIATTPDLGSSISGVIVFDETIRQRTSAGIRFVDVLPRRWHIRRDQVRSGSTCIGGMAW